MRTFLILLRKDFRLNRPLNYALLIATVCVYAFVCFPYLWLRLHGSIRYDFLDRYLLRAAGAGAVIPVLAAAVFGGTALARERREGWADFVAELPITRAKIILSKLTTAIASLAIFFGANLAVEVLCIHYGFSEYRYATTTYGGRRGWIVLVRPPGSVAKVGESDRGPRGLSATAWDRLEEEEMLVDRNEELLLVGVELFAVGWMLSTFLKSAVIASCAPFALTAAGGTLLDLYFNNLQNYESARLNAEFAGIAGVILILIGSAYYRRRVRP